MFKVCLERVFYVYRDWKEAPGVRSVANKNWVSRHKRFDFKASTEFLREEVNSHLPQEC